MENRYVVIKNMSGSKLGYYIPNRMVNRKFEKGASLRIDMEELREGLYDYGIKRMFIEGMLVFENKQDAIDLGMMEEEIPVVDSNEKIVAILTSGHSGNIFKLIKEAPDDEKDRILSIIIEHKIMNEATIKWAQELLHMDILTAVRNIQNAENAPDVQE